MEAFPHQKLASALRAEGGSDTTIDLGQVRKRRHVYTFDGADLGMIKEVWLGTDPTSAHARGDEEVCSRVEVQCRECPLQDVVMYVLYSAIAEVSSMHVTLNVDT